MTNSKALLNELSNLANIVDKQTGNAMYSSLKHTRSCISSFEYNGYYECFLHERSNNISFGPQSECQTPPTPCGHKKRNNKICQRIDTHTHTTSYGTHTFISRDDSEMNAQFE